MIYKVLFHYYDIDTSWDLSAVNICVNLYYDKLQMVVQASLSYAYIHFNTVLAFFMSVSCVVFHVHVSTFVVNKQCRICVTFDNRRFAILRTIFVFRETTLIRCDRFGMWRHLLMILRLCSRIRILQVFQIWERLLRFWSDLRKRRKQKFSNLK